MRNFIIILGFFLFFYYFSVNTASAASLQFDPAAITTSATQTFDVDVDVDAGSEQILATDAKITYDASLLEVVSITDGTFLTIGAKNYSNPGQIYIAGIIEDAGTYVTGTGTLATIKFRAKANGTARLSFVCVPGETATDSNIAKNTINADDIIVCSDNGTSVITIGTGGTNAATPTPRSSTTTTTNRTTTTTSRLPDTGIVDDISNMTIPAALLVLGGILIKLLVL